VRTGPTDFRAWSDRRVQGTAHVMSSCRMDDPDNPETAVDSGCRVLRVDGLRVVDASTFPPSHRLPREHQHHYDHDS
jgi:choline dehydrogenase-like flavoprotein